MTDQVDLAALRANPEETLTAVFTEHRPALRRLIAARLDRKIKGRVDPSDVIQDTMIDAFQRLNEYLANPTLPFMKWLFILAEQNAIMAHRRHVVTKKRTIQKEQNVGNEGTAKPNDLQQYAVSEITDPGQRVENVERMAQLSRAISMLNLQSQTVVRMRFLEGKSLAEIAEELDISVDAVAKRAMRSLLKLTDFATELGLNDTD